jgi:hypothetical protein
MLLIKNYSDWITPELMEHLKTHDGDTMPVWQPEKWQGTAELDQARELTRPGYAHRDDRFQQFNKSTPGMIDFDLPVILGDHRPMLWWIIKLYPGQMQPIHFDPHMLEAKNPRRYTMFLQDWKIGHVFVWNDQYISNYQAGDLFLWPDPMMPHGVVNIGHETRYTLQITTYDMQ